MIETVIKKTITVEFEGKRYALGEDSTMEGLLASLGMPADAPVRLQSKDGGFVLVSNN